MATDAAEITPNTPAMAGAEVPVPGTENDFMLGLNRLTIYRQIGLMVGLAASVALGLAIVLWLQEPNYQPLMNNMADQDVEQVTQVLNQNGIVFKVDPKTGILLVDANQIFNARVKLASAGISSDKSTGYELLDQEQGLGTSQFMETTRFKRGLEGELSRTISSFRNIRSARVHLAIPQRSVFVRDNRKPSASVLVDTKSGGTISQEQVDAIVNLVAGSVPEMNKEEVTVVDQKGNLLSKSANAIDRMVSREFEYSRKLEDVLSNRVNRILEPIIGEGRYRAEVSADVDFTAVEETEELFNPDAASLRSEQTIDEQRQFGGEGGVPGALANQPPAEGAAPQVAGGGAGGDGGGAPTNVRQQATRNFELDRTLSYTRHQQGKLKRLTVAVVIDDIRSINAETGEVTFTPWSENELERLTLLVRNAVGYSASRGDSVNVINTPFAPITVEEYIEPPIWENPIYIDYIFKALGLLVALIVIFGLIRPTLKNLAQSGAQAKELALAGDEDGLAQIDQLGEGSAEERVTLSASDDFLLPGASEGYDKQLNALKGLVAEDPARVAQVIRQWINTDE